MDVGVRAKHDSREGGGRAKQDARAEEARAELATWQECYREVAYTEPMDVIFLMIATYRIMVSHALAFLTS